jgi:uncharacterized Zn-binding protein involved in type VI secretion
MGEPAAVMNDQIRGHCIHLIPSPSGAIPSGPLPFSAPLLQGLATRVLIGGKPAAVQSSSGLNTPAHPGLHPSDPFVLPLQQRGAVVGGSMTVLFEGRPAAKTGTPCTCCTLPGQLQGSAISVLIGG